MTDKCQHANVETRTYLGSTETFVFCDDCGENLSESRRIRRLREAAIDAVEMYGEDALEQYAEQKRRGRLTRRAAIAEFRREVLPLVRRRFESDGVVDEVARREAWNNWTDGLCKSGRISDDEYASWEGPDDE